MPHIWHLGLLSPRRVFGGVSVRCAELLATGMAVVLWVRAGDEAAIVIRLSFLGSLLRRQPRRNFKNKLFVLLLAPEAEEDSLRVQATDWETEDRQHRTAEMG